MQTLPSRLARSFVLLALLVLPSVAQDALEKKPWNVLVMIADDLSYAELSCFGQEYVSTSNIDRLSYEGVSFTRAYAPACGSTPSRQGILTGRYPQRSGVENDVQFVDPLQGIPGTEVTLGERFAAAGYQTAYVGKWGLGMHRTHFPSRHGFDDFYGFLRDWRRHYPTKEGEKADPRWALMIGNDVIEDPDFRHIDDLLADQTLERLKSYGDKPFCHVHSFSAAHTPLQIIKEECRELRNTYRGVLSERRTRMICVINKLDQTVGKILDGLDELGLAENTIVVFCTDSGGRLSKDEPSSNGPHRGWAGDMWEGSLRVPLLVRWPGVIEESSSYDGMVSLLDVVPTLTAAAGATGGPEQAMDGVDLLPFLKGESEGVPHTELYFRQGFLKGAAIRPDGSKAVWHDGTRSSHYYNVLEDPGEATRIDTREPARKGGLRQKWREWANEMKRASWKRVKVEQEEEEAPTDGGDAPADDEGGR